MNKKLLIFCTFLLCACFANAQTPANGVLTEVYYPNVTVANLPLLQFGIVNPKTKKIETPDVVHQRYALGKRNNPENIENNAVKLTMDSCFRKWLLSQSSDFKGTLDYIRKLNNPHTLKCNSDKYTAVFFYKGEGKNVEIVGDFTNWKPKGLQLNQLTTSNFDKNLKFISLENMFAPTARVEYKLIVDGKWILDPLNPNKIDNGIGGENSFFTMPDYQPTAWDKEIEKSPLMPEIRELEVESKKFGKRKVKIYVPSEYFKRSVLLRLPVLYLQDGSDYISRAKAINVLENLTAAKKIEPFMIVFIDPKDRMKEYWANDNFADYVALEIVPAVEKKYFSTIKTGRENRMLLGASLGGVTSFWIGLKHPDKFGRIGGQSVSFGIDNERVVKELEKLDSSKTPFKFYIDDGTLEGTEDSRKVVEILKKNGFSVVYKEAEAGHNWTAWRDRLADVFIGLMN